MSSRVTSYPGLYRTALTPYVKGPLEAFSTHERIVLCFASQVAKTTILFVMIGYSIDQDPGPLLLVLPTGDLAKRLSKKRLQVIISDSPSLARHKTPAEDDWQLLSYNLDRMNITLVGSNSPAGISSDPIRYLFLDETDKFATETTREADSLSLAMERTKSFWNARTVITSTPTNPDGNVWHQFKLSDQRHFQVPCLKCGAFQKLELEYLRWPDLKSTKIRDLDDQGWYECVHCNGQINDRDKPEMLSHGQWKPEAPGEKWAGFHLNCFYGPWKKNRFGAIAAEWLRSRKYPDKHRNFVNSWLALPWDPQEEGADAVSEKTLVASKQSYRKNTIPCPGSVLFMGADVQETALYYTVYAWARKDDLLQTWLINYGIVESFDDLLRAAEVEYPCVQSAKTYGVTAVAIDSRYRTSEVYAFCRQNRGFFAVKGARQVRGETGSIPWKEIPVDKRIIGGLKYLLINTAFWKEAIYAGINRRKDFPRIWHIPEDVDSTYLRHLSSEREVRRRNKRGQWERIWVTKKGHDANHWLDASVYAHCLADVFRVRILPEVGVSGVAKGGDPQNRPVRKHQEREKRW